MNEFYNLSIKYAYIEYTQNNYTDTYTQREINTIKREITRKATQEKQEQIQKLKTEQERRERLEKLNELFIKKMKGEKIIWLNLKFIITKPMHIVVT